MRFLSLILTVYLFMLPGQAVAQEGVLVDYRSVHISSPVVLAGFSVQVGKPKLIENSSTTYGEFNKHYDLDSSSNRFCDLWDFLESDTICLSGGQASVSFEWKLWSREITAVLRPDSILRIEHQVYNVDTREVIATVLQAAIGTEELVYDTLSGGYARVFTAYGTRTHELQSTVQQRVVLRVRAGGLRDSTDLTWYVATGSLGYRDSSEYYDLHPYLKIQLPHQVSNIVSFAEPGILSPQKSHLDQNYPNPFNPVTTIRYTISEAGPVLLRVCDVLGRQVARLVDEQKSAGTFIVKFDGSQLAPGIYFCYLSASGTLLIRKMILDK